MYQGYASNMCYSPTQMRLNQMEQMYPQYNNQMMYNNQYQGNQRIGIRRGPVNWCLAHNLKQQ